MSKSGAKDKSYERSMYKYENCADKMPDKSIKKFKRKDRQKARKHIRKELNES